MQIKIEQSDIPENIKQIMNSITLFDGKETMLYETGFDLCQKLADELKRKQAAISVGIEMDEKYIAMMMDSCPGPQVSVTTTLEILKDRKDALGAELRAAHSGVCSEELADELLRKSKELEVDFNNYLEAKQNQEWYRRLYRTENGIKSARNLKLQIAEAEAFFRDELPEILRKKYNLYKNESLN